MTRPVCLYNRHSTTLPAIERFAGELEREVEKKWRRAPLPISLWGGSDHKLSRNRDIWFGSSRDKSTDSFDKLRLAPSFKVSYLQKHFYAEVISTFARDEIVNMEVFFTLLQLLCYDRAANKSHIDPLLAM